ncbi:MAG: hypothetical protein ACKVHE_31980 [Planctomycetales bacterium]|jgi:hypothetical protein
MSSAEVEYGDLPASLQSHLEQFCADVAAGSGENLLSVAVYGSVVKSSKCVIGETPVPVLVVPQDASVPFLKPIASVIRRAIKSFHAAPFVVSLHDLQTSTDIFPIKFLDMQTHHLLLSGRDVLSELDISTQHLRLRCEQELCNLLLRMRQVYVRNSGDNTALDQAAAHAIEPFFMALGAAVYLTTELLPDSESAIADSAAKVMSLDREALERLLAFREGRHGTGPDAVAGLFNELLEPVELAADFVDRLETGP